MIKDVQMFKVCTGPNELESKVNSKQEKVEAGQSQHWKARTNFCMWARFQFAMANHCSLKNIGPCMKRWWIHQTEALRTEIGREGVNWQNLSKHYCKRLHQEGRNGKEENMGMHLLNLPAQWQHLVTVLWRHLQAPFPEVQHQTTSSSDLRGHNSAQLGSWPWPTQWVGPLAILWPGT